MGSKAGEIGNDYGGPTNCFPTQPGQGPKASCVRSSPLWVRTQEKAKRDRRPRTAGLEVGDPEVVGLKHGWERGAGSLPGPWACHKMEAKGRKWRPGGKGSSRAQEESHLDLGARYSTPRAVPTPHGPQDPSPTPCNNPHQPIHQAQEGMPTPESHV